MQVEKEDKCYQAHTNTESQNIRHNGDDFCRNSRIFRISSVAVK